MEVMEMRQKTMSTREIKRKTGVDINEISGMLNRVESLIKTETEKRNIKKRMTIEKDDILYTIEKTITELKKELDLPSGGGNQGPVVKIRQKGAS
jgi:UV DNA damage repair endonuclease